jgi:hypothetical protein
MVIQTKATVIMEMRSKIMTTQYPANNKTVLSVIALTMFNLIKNMDAPT